MALIILDGVEISYKQYKSINPDQCESIIKLNPESAMERYGKWCKNGIIILTSKSTAKTLTDTDETIYILPEVMPEFRGGEKALLTFIRQFLRYPEEATSIGLQGTVFISFVVCKDGKITNAKIVDSPGHSLEVEALRVINIMPNWSPGKNNGKAVNTFFIMPFRFVMQ